MDREDEDSGRHAPLSRDIQLLGELLGQVLREQEGSDLYGMVERVRALAKAGRAGDPGARDELQALISGLAVADMQRVARAFAHFLALSNIAEQQHRIRRRRQYQADSSAPPQRGSMDQCLGHLLQLGIAPNDVAKTLRELRVELVMTAHPTETRRRTQQQQHRAIALLLRARDLHGMTPREQDQNRTELLRVIAACWATEDVRRHKPTPEEEVRGGLAVFEQVLWTAVPRYLRELSESLETHCGTGLPLGATPIRFGSWMGGDRDGNPNVTPETTARACLLARWMAADLYLGEVELLREELSMNECSEELRAEVGEAWEPYRELLRAVRSRLDITREHLRARLEGEATAEAATEPGLYTAPEQLREPLLLCWRSLQACHHGTIASGRLLDLIRRLDTFSLSLVQLDIRQESDRHTEALDSITEHLKLGSYAGWSEEKRQDFLLRQLQEDGPLIPDALWMDKSTLTPSARDVLETFAVAAEQPPGILGAYVISMAGPPSDVLAVELLQREARLAYALPTSGPPQRVVPLFETEADLNAGGEVLRALLSTPWVRERIRDLHDNRFEVMLGYSDSAKDAGRLAASWALYKAQERLVEVCDEFGIRLTLFPDIWGIKRGQTASL